MSTATEQATIKKTLQGTVVRARTDKTRRVEVPRQYRHSKYGKIIRARTVCYVHDEKNESKEGDLVEIVESRPRSKTKRWELKRVIRSSEPVT